MNEQLTVLHSHYEKSYEWIRKLELKRNRLFLLQFLSIGALLITYQQPDKALGTVNALLSEQNIQFLINPEIILSAAWIIVFYVKLEYFTSITNIDRKYSYLHDLEDKLNNLSQPGLFEREGKAYAVRYPTVSWVKWSFYQIFTPILILVCQAIIYLRHFECSLSPSMIVSSCAISGSVFLTLPHMKTALIERPGWSRNALDETSPKSFLEEAKPDTSK